MNELLVEINDLSVEELAVIVENYWLELAESETDPAKKRTFMQKAGDVGRRIISGIGGAVRGGVDALKQGYSNAGKTDFRKALEILKSSDLLTPEVLNAIKKADRDKRGVEILTPQQKLDKAKAEAQAKARDPKLNPFATQYRREQFELTFKEWLMANPN